MTHSKPSAAIGTLLVSSHVSDALKTHTSEAPIVADSLLWALLWSSMGRQWRVRICRATACYFFPLPAEGKIFGHGWSTVRRYCADDSMRLPRSLLGQEPHIFESSSRALYTDSLVHVSRGMRHSSACRRRK